MQEHSPLCHFVVGQRKIKQVEIVFDILRLSASGNHSDALLGQEAEQHLRRSLVVFFYQCKYDRLGEHFIAVALTQRGVGHVSHPLFVHPSPLSAALAVEVRFDLIDRRDNFVVGNQIKKLIGLKVGNTDGTDSSLGVQFLQNAPCRVIVSEGSVQEQQVNIVCLQISK